ncbi:MAG TPA: 5'-nucleotidase, lipoprotein e(P4) family [Thermomonas sp.]|uniref:5'-nucleotidase, lipoprotein e(P4) family n=1 Tax=Thermomonas sp. TaxID=1971895 RepID=UPI002D1842E1|nr:5'-nucleotidase, lipoprotein e(P4) family [Thermomonas sp.]HOU64499.1 5'-nucleotidase, lipoprotein e(P4) family [Thermomonas sp.]HOZ23236.1 5'-nucleotidase, lipoprotein e(P4) family [Thermomonas sp.]HPW13103.1 5'-nucleotidase, lipoprotein e(P4) family [Thermomonas sp.]
MRPAVAVSLLAAALSLAACKPTSLTAPSGAAAKPATATAAKPATGDVGANDNLNAVLWVQRAAEYEAVTQTVYRAAADQLDAALKQPNWDALVPGERGNAATGLPPAVVMDVDETVLDNSPYQARLVHDGASYDEATWDLWVAEKKAKPVPGVVDFAKAAAAKGVTILYISNRAVHLKDATIANLRAEGLPVKDDSVFLGLGTFVEGCEQNGSEKLCRRKLAGQKYRVLMQFGDQLGDFAEIVSNTPKDRDALYAEYADWFGERWYMLPNPTYGSWEPAVFNNAWEQPAADRRKAKLDALELAK